VIYRLVMALAPVPDGRVSRGSSVCEHTHWFDAAGDSAAGDAMVAAIDHLVNGGLGNRWCVLRGGEAHAAILERWPAPNTCRRIGMETFALPELQTGYQGQLGDTGVTYTARYVHPWNTTARACLVQEQGAGGTVRRIFLGPLSTLCLRTELELSGPDPLPALPLLLPDPVHADPLPTSEGMTTLDLWPPSITDLAYAHVSDLGGVWSGIATPVVRTRGGATSAVTEVRAARNVARLTTRGAGTWWTFGP
jgi:hypothetical protein